MRALLTLLLIGASLIVGPAPSRAQGAVEAAEAFYNEGAVPDAERAYRDALANGHHDAPTLASVLWHLGVLSAINRAEAEAHDFFTRALAIDPSLHVPVELWAAWQEQYRELQQQAEQISVELEPVDASPDRDTQVLVRVLHAPAGFAVGLRVAARPEGADPWQLRALVEQGEVTIPAAAWRGSRRLALRVDVLDAYDNTIASAEAQLVATTATSATNAVNATAAADATNRSATTATNAPSAMTAAAPAERSVARNPWLWTGVAAVVLGAVLTSVLLTQRDTRYEGGSIEITRDAR